MLFSSCRKKKKPNTERVATIALLGLDESGKSTFLASILGNSCSDVEPTWGFVKERVSVGSLQLDIFDLGGGKKIRGYWANYLANCHAVVFIVDASDSERLDEAKEAFTDITASEYLVGKPVLLVANKQDLPGAVGGDDLVDRVGAAAIREAENFLAVEELISLSPDDEGPSQDLLAALSDLVGELDRNYPELSVRVARETEEYEEELREKRRAKMERVRLMKEEEERVAEVVQMEPTSP